jgi:hypothetical protein
MNGLVPRFTRQAAEILSAIFPGRLDCEWQGLFISLGILELRFDTTWLFVSVLCKELHLYCDIAWQSSRPESFFSKNKRSCWLSNSGDATACTATSGILIEHMQSHESCVCGDLKVLLKIVRGALYHKIWFIEYVSHFPKILVLKRLALFFRHLGYWYKGVPDIYSTHIQFSQFAIDVESAINCMSVSSLMTDCSFPSLQPSCHILRTVCQKMTSLLALSANSTGFSDCFVVASNTCIWEVRSLILD